MKGHFSRDVWEGRMGKPCGDLGKKHSEQNVQLVQRPRGEPGPGAEACAGGCIREQGAGGGTWSGPVGLGDQCRDFACV